MFFDCFAPTPTERPAHDNQPCRHHHQLTSTQESSYANQALERQLTDDTITKEEAITIVGGLLPAGVDTTGGMLSWKMLHLATHPEVQDRIHGELIKAMNGGELTEEAISSDMVPFLYAFMRESASRGTADTHRPAENLSN